MRVWLGALVMIVMAVVASACVGPVPDTSEPATPTPSDTPRASSATAVSPPASASGAPGRVACPDIVTCLPVARALRDAGVRDAGENETLVYAPRCGPTTSCPPGVHILAVMVPAHWRLGDPFQAWTVEGPEDKLEVSAWPRSSLPEDVLVVVRAYVDR